MSDNDLEHYMKRTGELSEANATLRKALEKAEITFGVLGGMMVTRGISPSTVADEISTAIAEIQKIMKGE